MQIEKLSATSGSCIDILCVSLVSFAIITLCVTSHQVFVVVYFIIDSVQILLMHPCNPYNILCGRKCQLHGRIKWYQLRGHYNVVMFRLSRYLKNSSYVLGCNAMRCCGRIPTFQRSMLPQSLWWCGEDGKKSNIDIDHQLEILQIKQAKLFTSLPLLLRCRDQNTIPCFLHRSYIYAVFSPSWPFHLEDRGSMDLWNIGILPQCCMALQPRGPQLETSPLWKPCNYLKIACSVSEYSKQIEPFIIFNFFVDLGKFYMAIEMINKFQHFSFFFTLSH